MAAQCQAHGDECPGTDGPFPCEVQGKTCPDCLDENLSDYWFEMHAGGMCILARAEMAADNAPDSFAHLDGMDEYYSGTGELIGDTSYEDYLNSH